MLTPTSIDLLYRATREVPDRNELVRQLGIRSSTFEIYFDAIQSSRLLRSSGQSLSRCSTCSGTGCAPLIDLVQGAGWVRSCRPIANVDIDQCSVSNIDLARRVHILLEAHDPASTSFAFLGDDDLASLLLLRSYARTKVLVIDIDTRILSAIRTNVTSDSEDSLRLVNMDVAGFPSSFEQIKQYIEGYDVVVTDPPYADDGMLAFVYTASALMRLGGQLYLAAPRMFAESWTEDLMHLVQIELLNLGFVIDAILPSFSAYNESDVLSSLIVATKRRNTAIEFLVNKIRTLTLHRFYTTRRSLQRVNDE